MSKRRPGTPPGKDPLDDFRNMIWVVWNHLGLSTPTTLQYDMAERLQYGPDRDIIQAFRGAAKSYITSTYCVWRLRRNPLHKIMPVSASKERADQFATFCRRLIDEVPCLQHLRPQPGQRDSRLSFDVAGAIADHSPSIRSLGVMGQLTGSRADLIIADDVEVPNNSETQAMRDKLRERVKEFDAILKPGGEIKYLGTPQTEMTLYSELKLRGYECCIWPARYPTPKQAESYGEDLAPLIVKALEKGAEPGTSTEPTRFSDEDLAKRELSYGKAGFSLQFMLDPKLSDVDRYPLKLANIIVMDSPDALAPGKIVWGGSPELVIPDLPNVGLRGDKWHRPWMVSKDEREWAPYQSTIMFIDPAGTGADEASYAILSFLNGYLFLRGIGGFQHGYAEESLKGFATAARDKAVSLILCEDNFGDGMFRELLKPILKAIHPCTIEGVKNSKQKEARIIDTLDPILGSHRLIVDPAVIQHDYASVERHPPDVRNNYRLFYQMTRITKEKGALRQDGRLDALAGAAAYFAPRMARDADDAVAEAKEAALEEELRKFMLAAGGRPPDGPKWVRI